MAMHSYLSRVLKDRGIVMSSMQQSVYDLVKQKNSVFMNSQTGCGKTLAYLIPILDNILKQPQNAVNGAVILTVTKELCMQTYKQIRLLDPDGHLQLSRTGSIAYFSGIIQLLNKKEKKSRQEEDSLESLSIDNIIKSVNRTNTDILVTTPNLFLEMMSLGRDNFNPRFVVMDQADILFQNIHQTGDTTMKLLQLLASRSSSNRQENLQRQFILSCSSFPPMLMKKQSKSLLANWFNNLQFVQNGSHRLPKSLSVQFRRVTQQNRFDTLLDIIKNTKTPIIIFCNNSSSINELKMLLNQHDYNPQVYMNSLSTQQRVKALSNFKEILLCTDLGSRGFDHHVDLVIQYDCTNNIVSYLNRAGRTARFNKQGKIISLIRPKNEQFANKIQQILKNDQDFTSLMK